eukprot:COSAG01_NODE_34397_length_548_cov_1.051225_2_plen_77_part_01
MRRNSAQSTRAPRRWPRCSLGWLPTAIDAQPSQLHAGWSRELQGDGHLFLITIARFVEYLQEHFYPYIEKTATIMIP